MAKDLRRHRLERNFSQETFAFEVGVHRTYISDLERGTPDPPITIVEKLATEAALARHARG